MASYVGNYNPTLSQNAYSAMSGVSTYMTSATASKVAGTESPWKSYYYHLGSLGSDPLIDDAREIELFKGGDQDDWQGVKQLAVEWLKSNKDKKYKNITTVKRISRKKFKAQIDDFDLYYGKKKLVDEALNDREIDTAYWVVESVLNDSKWLKDKTHGFAYKILSAGGLVAGKHKKDAGSLYVVFDLPQDMVMDRLVGKNKDNGPMNFMSSLRRHNITSATIGGPKYVTTSGTV